MEYYKTPQGRPVTWKGDDYVKISKKEHGRLVVLESIAYLMRVLGDSPKVTCTVIQVSASGMTRHAMVQTIIDGNICDVSPWVSDVLGWPQTKRGFVTVAGCGMDMIFHLRSCLSYAVYGKDGTISEY